MRLVFALVLITACGDGVPGPDAAIGIDGPERGRVMVHVKGSGAGFDQVFFQNADSTIALLTRTNAAGDASALMSAGGFVSVLNGSTLYTWTGVQVGDDLTLDLSFEAFSDVFPSATVRIDPMDGAFDYYLFSRCESFRRVNEAIDAPFAPFFEPCTQKTDLLLLAWSAGPIAYRYRGNADLVSATIDMRGPYQPFESSVDVIGPSNRTVSVRQKLDGIEYTTNTSGVITDTHLVLPTQMPAIPGTRVQSSAHTFDFKFPKEDGGANLTTELAAVLWGPATDRVTLDLTTPALRDFTDVPEFDDTSTTLRWSETPDGAKGDVVWASMGDGAFQWIVIGERTDETFLRLPVMPYASLRLRPQSFFLNNLVLIAADGGYDRLRPYLLGHWNPSETTLWPMNEPSGHVNFRSVR